MLIPILLFGQNETNTNINFSKNIIYAELHVGRFTKFVLNYEKQISSGKKVSWYGRLGGGFGLKDTDGYIDDNAGLGGLGAISLLKSKKNNHFELNAGAFLGFEKRFGIQLGGVSNGRFNILIKDFTYEPFIFPILNLGYRYQKPGRGFIFRANVGLPSIGMSLGYAF
jgi:hypothetical protein